MENVGVNRAPVRIRQSGRVGDSGSDIFEKENLNKTVNKKNLTSVPGFSSDSPFGSDLTRGVATLFPSVVSPSELSNPLLLIFFYVY